MGIFDNVKSDSGKDEVEINVSETDNSIRMDSEDQKESRLKNEVESSLTDSRGSSAPSSTNSSVSLDEVHSQNQRIIELLQRLVDQSSSSSNKAGSKSDSSSSNYKSSGRSSQKDENEMSGGLDGVL